MNAKIESRIERRLTFGCFTNERTGDGRVIIKTKIRVDEMVVENALVKGVASREHGISIIKDPGKGKRLVNNRR